MIQVFPGGAAGVGLLILRASVVGSLFVLASGHDGAAWIQPLALLAAITLILGIRTRIVVLATLAVPIATFLAGDFRAPVAFLHLANSVALAFLGPGALSADALLFGRRRVRLPNIDNTQG